MTSINAKSTVSRKHQGDVRNQRNNRWFNGVVGLFGQDEA